MEEGRRWACWGGQCRALAQWRSKYHRPHNMLRKRPLPLIPGAIPGSDGKAQGCFMFLHIVITAWNGSGEWEEALPWGIVALAVLPTLPLGFATALTLNLTYICLTWIFHFDVNCFSLEKQEYFLMNFYLGCALFPSWGEEMLSHWKGLRSPVNLRKRKTVPHKYLSMNLIDIALSRLHLEWPTWVISVTFSAPQISCRAKRLLWDPASRLVYDYAVAILHALSGE